MTNTQRRTVVLLAYLKDNPDEFTMLKGILCMAHPFTRETDLKRVAGVFDGLMIATRMDAINAEIVATVKREALERTGRVASQACMTRTGMARQLLSDS